MLYENTIQKLKNEIINIKTRNMKLQAEVVTLKDEIRCLKNDMTFLENYNSRLLYSLRKNIDSNDVYKESRKWRQSH